MNNIHREAIAIPLEQEAHDRAITFATQQSTPQKSRCVYLNTLAVYAVHTYLKWLQIDTDLDEGDSWHPGLLPLFDVTDCVVSGVGRLECRPVLPGETSFTLPQERLEERVGYVAVQFQESLDEVDLLGFVPAFDPDNLPTRVNLNQLLPIEDLPELVGSLQENESELQAPVDSTVLATTEASVSLGEMLENLRQWFGNLFEGDWLEPSMVFVPAYRGDRTRSSEPKSEASIRRAKIIDFGLPTGATQALALVIELTPESEQEVGVIVQIYPDNARHLPLGLQMMALDESGATIIDEQAESGADSIELEFGIEPLERFSIKLSLGNVSVTESISPSLIN